MANKTVDFSKGREIPNYGLAGKTGKFKGDDSGRTVLIAKDYSIATNGRPKIPGIVGLIIFDKNGGLSTMPEVPLQCLKMD